MIVLCCLRLLAATLSGTVSDPSGSAVSGAKVTVRNAQQTILGSEITGGAGEFAFADLPSGSFLVRVEHANFIAVETPVRVTARGGVERRIVLSVSPVQSEITVTAESGSVESLGGTPQRVNRISRDLLEERTATTIVEAAANEPGVDQQRTVPGMGAFFVRGMTGKGVAVYRDGVRYSTSAQRGGVSTFQALTDAAHLDSVEILRGPNSAQYGSDALGGTVHLLSRSPSFTADRRTLGIEGSTFYQSAAHAWGAQTTGSFSGQRLAAILSLTGRRTNTLRTGGALDSHGAVTRFLGLPGNVPGGRLSDTAFSQYGGAIHVQAQLTPLRHAIFHYERAQIDGAKRYDQLLGGDGNLIADLRNLMLDFGYVRLQGYRLGGLDQAWVSASYNAQREERVNQGGAGNPSAGISHQYERLRAWGMQAQAEKSLGAHGMVFGLESYFERMRAPAFTLHPETLVTALTRPRVPDGAAYKQIGVFAQDAWETPGKWLRITGAIRWNATLYRSRAANSPLVNGTPLWPDDKLSASAWSGRVGLAARPANHLAVHALYSRGFRAPNMTDLGSLGLQGNGFYEVAYKDVEGRQARFGDTAGASARPAGAAAALRPETTDSLEAGATLTTSRLRLEAGGFRMVLNDSLLTRTLLLPPGASGASLGDQIIADQFPNGAVLVPAAINPVLIRVNSGRAIFSGLEQSLRWRVAPQFTLTQNLSWIRAADAASGRPPDIEPGVPAPSMNLTLLYAPPSRRFWIECYLLAVDRQDRLSSLALADRRIGAPRSRQNIASFFNNGARVRGLVDNGVLLATGETLPQVQARVLGNAGEAPLFTGIPGYATAGVRGGFAIGARNQVMIDISNLSDRNYRGIGWGVDAAGRGVLLRWKFRL